MNSDIDESVSRWKRERFWPCNDFSSKKHFKNLEKEFVYQILVAAAARLLTNETQANWES